MAEFRKQIYSPINPQKYVGRTPIIMRSFWELKFARFLDISPSILEWSSESIAIIYPHPITKKPTRYFPDFLIKVQDKDGNVVVEVIEIKPFKQTIPPVVTKGKHKRTLFTEAKAWAINKAKWTAALQFCQNRGFIFRILTEKDLFH